VSGENLQDDELGWR